MGQEQTQRHRDRACGCQGEGVGRGRRGFALSRRKRSYTGWIGNKVLPGAQHPVINHPGKEHERECIHGLPGELRSKEPISHAGDPKDTGLITGLGRSPGGGHGNPPKCSRLEDPMDRGAWRYSPRGCKEWVVTERLTL